MNKKASIEEQLRQGRMVSAFTEGDSMEPLLSAGKSHVILAPLHRNLKVGELPIYKRPDGIYIIHRIVGVEDTHYYTRGDNCVRSEKIPKEWVIGTVVEIYRKGRNISVTDKSYLRYVSIWNHTYPLRSIAYRIRAKKRNSRIL